MSETKGKKQTFKLIIGAGLEFSFSPQHGVKLRLVKPDFSRTLGSAHSSANQRAEQPILIQSSHQPAASKLLTYSAAPPAPQSKEQSPKGTLLDIYC
jgi:hypothetical protein